jgi:positive regulator of sigma E activity
MTKKAGTPQRKYANCEACSKCSSKAKCTTAEKGRIITRKENEDFVEIVNNRTKVNKDKYNQRQEIIEHVFAH